MKKTIVCCLFIFILCIPTHLFCVDLGGYVDNTTSFTTNRASGYNDTGFYQIARLSLWLMSRLGKNWSFSMLGNYTFEMDYPLLVDMDQLVFKGKWPFIEDGPSLFSVQLGRFQVSEFSHLILDHVMDGVLCEFSYPVPIITLGLGYTGLIAKHSSTIILSKADTNDEDDPDVLFATPRLLGLLQFHFPEFIGGQDLYLSALFQKDLRSKDQILEEGAEELEGEEGFNLSKNMGGYYDSIYSGAGVSGSFSSSFFYNVFGYFQTGRTLSYLEDADSITGRSYQYMPIFAFLGGTEVQYYTAALSYSVFSLSFIYSSGDADYNFSYVEGNLEDSSTLFIPVSQGDQFVIFNPKLGNIFYIKGKYTVKPFAMLRNEYLDNILAVLEAIGFFRATTGVITEGLNPDSDALYLGTEIDFIINFRPFSDLGMSLSTGYFIPNSKTDGAFFERREFEFLGKFDLSFSF